MGFTWLQLPAKLSTKPFSSVYTILTLKRCCDFQVWLSGPGPGRSVKRISNLKKINSALVQPNCSWRIHFWWRFNVFYLCNNYFNPWKDYLQANNQVWMNLELAFFVSTQLINLNLNSHKFICLFLDYRVCF